MRSAATGIPLLLIVLLGSLLGAGCSSTPQTTAWSEPGVAPKPYRNLLLLGVAANAKVRRAYEGSFAVAFKAVGAKARPVYEVLPGGGFGDVKALKQAVGRSGADGVVVTHLVGERAAAADGSAGSQLDPTRSGSLYPYCQRVYGYVTQPGYYANFPALRLETNLYDAAREKLVWSARSPPMDPGSETTTINEVIADTARRLAEAGYLSR